MDSVIESGAGVDWITCTRPHAAGVLAAHSEALFMRLADLASMAAPEDLALARIAPRQLLGFSGLGMPSLFVGESDTHVLVQASGWLAETVWRDLSPYEWKATRIDVQETLWYKRTLGRMWAADLADGARSHRGKRAGRGPMPLVDLYDSDAGCTLYVGGRTASQRGRCYDKFAESGDGRYRNAYRMEVQCRDDAAQMLHSVLHSSGLADANKMRQFVWSWFDDRWIRMRSSDAPPLRLAAIREDSEWLASSKLAWMEAQVRPTVLRLLPFVEKSVIMASLGLASEAITETSVEE